MSSEAAPHRKLSCWPCSNLATDWPDMSIFENKDELSAQMDFVREVCSLAKAVREENRLRNRLPLKEMTIAGQRVQMLENFIPLLEEEVNVKQVRLETNLSLAADPLLYIKTPLVGKRLGSALKEVLAASKTSDWSVNEKGELEIAGQVLAPEEFERRLVLKEGLTGQASADNTFVVLLDTKVDPQLEAEGIARDFVRVVQSLRKEQNLDVSDRIHLKYETSDEKTAAALTQYALYIQEQTLALSLEREALAFAMTEEEIGDGKVKISLQKA